MKVTPIRTRVFKEGESLADFIAEHIEHLNDGDVLAVTSKIVALSEGRVAGVAQRDEIIQKESDWAKRSKYVWLTLKQGMLLANAGVDESNAGGRLILLPEDSFAAAAALHHAIRKLYDLDRFGIVITDSRIFPLRTGVVGVALGYAGFQGLRDYRGKEDLTGRPLKFTQTDIADSLATAATVVMGEGSEQQPLAIIEDAPVEFTESVDRSELIISREDDMYRDLFS